MVGGLREVWNEGQSPLYVRREKKEVRFLSVPKDISN